MEPPPEATAPAQAALAATGAATTSSTAAVAATGSAAAPGGSSVLFVRPRDAARDAPLRKMTTGLLATYKLINAKYYEAKKARQARQANKQEEYQVTIGDMLGTRYRVEESMGKGSFGQVVAATDMRTGTRVAVKVIKNKDAFRRQARTEVKLLELLNRKDPDDQWCIGACATSVNRLASEPATRPLHTSIPIVLRYRPPTLTCHLITTMTSQCGTLSSSTTMATRALFSNTCRLTSTSC